MNKSHFFQLLIVIIGVHVLAESGTDSAEGTFESISNAQNQLKSVANRNVTLVIGIDEIEKSLLIQYAAGDNSQLKSVAGNEEGTEYQIYGGYNPENDSTAGSALDSGVPRMIVDEGENVWCDWLVSKQIRNTTEEITSTFLKRGLVEQAGGVKFALAVNCMVFINELDALLTHVMTLINDVDRYKNSVALVVTKVPQHWRKAEWSLETFEQSVKNSTVKFLRKHRSDLENSKMNYEKIQLIDAVLDGEAKISVFWRPNAAGAFNTIDEMVYGRRQIRESILEQTPSVKCEQNDFDFPLSEPAQIIVTNMVQQTSDRLVTELMGIDKRALNALQHSIESTEDIHDKISFLSNVTAICQLHDSGEAPLEQLSALRIKLNLTSASIDAEINRIKRHEERLHMLDALAQPKVTFSIGDWVARSSLAYKFATTNYDWYSFLGHVSDFFASAEVQKNISAYNVADLADWGQMGKPQGLKIDANNFDEFIRRFPNYSTFEVMPSRLRELNDAVVVSLLSAPQLECNGETMTIKGHDVKSSHIQPSQCLPNVISKINVFATGTFYVDSDLNLTGYRAVKVFAKTWNVLRTTTFTLLGRDGIMSTNLQPLPPGTGGQPGEPGMNSANFFGLAQEIINGKALTIHLIGGKGTDGHAGTSKNEITATFTDHVYNSPNDDSFEAAAVPTFFLNSLKTDGYDAEFLDDQSFSQYNILSGMGTLRYRIHPRECCGPSAMGGSGEC